MKIIWEITPDDVAKVNVFFESQKNSCFVRERTRRNLSDMKCDLSKADFWVAMVGCLLTTQQRSGPDSPISRFLDEKPFPLDYALCAGQADLEKFVGTTLTKFGGIRRATTIGREVKKNYDYLERGGWGAIFDVTTTLRHSSTIAQEREAAAFVDENLAGFGPKQSRNLLQWLGLTKYETPIDSRITKWLNEFGFPFRLTAAALADPYYYQFVEDGLQQLCAASSIYPCQMDAAIFASYDGDAWTDKNSMW